MDRPLSVQHGRSGFLDEGPPGIREFHCPLLVADKEGVSKFLFELCYLLTKRGLGNVQPVGGTGEIQFFGQNNDCMQVTHFNISKQKEQTPI
jgi:hypothetical protein